MDLGSHGGKEANTETGRRRKPRRSGGVLRLCKNVLQELWERVEVQQMNHLDLKIFKVLKSLPREKTEVNGEEVEGRVCCRMILYPDSAAFKHLELQSIPPR